MVHYILKAINDTFEFKTELNNLLDKYRQVDRKAMGFVNGWEELEVWR
jgi:abortive infection bacteriophage resistance protein